MANNHPRLLLDKITINRHDKALLSINASVEKGHILSVMGASGSGKSTLLHAISGQLASPFTLLGNIVIDGKTMNNVPAYRRKVGYMFQDALLFDHMTVEGNIAFGLPPKKYTTKSARERAILGMLEAVDLSGLQKRAVSSLSGGQQARVSLLRTLASEPKVVLLDEPFSKLDTAMREHIRAWTFTTLKEQGVAALLVTHDADDAAAANGDIIELTPC